jgi:hypothetical protein
VCAASRHNLSRLVGVEEASGSPWEHAEVAKRRSKGKAPSKRGEREVAQDRRKGKKTQCGRQPIKGQGCIPCPMEAAVLAGYREVKGLYIKAPGPYESSRLLVEQFSESKAHATAAAVSVLLCLLSLSLCVRLARWWQ